MAGRQVHTTYSKQAGNWRNISAGSSRPAKVYATKAQAQAVGRQQAINSKAEHIIHNQNGQIASRNSYGRDPFPPKG